MTIVQVIRKEMEKLKERIVPKRREPIIIKFWDGCYDYWIGKPVPCPEKPCPGKGETDFQF